MPKDSTAAVKIGLVRSALAMTQEAFAKQLEVGQSLVSAWERGEYAPSAENYMKLGNLAEKHASRVVADIANDLHLYAAWCFEQAGGRRMAMLAAAAYKQGFIEGQEHYPDDPIAQRRNALAFQKRILRRKAKKKE
jgi:transcriptional regulator with XRE-family HTH domain